MAISVRSPGDPCHSSCSCRYARPIVLGIHCLSEANSVQWDDDGNHILCPQERVRDKDPSVGSAPLGEEMQELLEGGASIPAWGQAGV